MKKSNVFLFGLFFILFSTDLVVGAKREGAPLDGPSSKEARVDGQANVHGQSGSCAFMNFLLQRGSRVLAPISQPQPNPTDSVAPYLGCGLINSDGSSCFMNSALQILYHIPEILVFLDKHIDDYFDPARQEIPGDFLIPGKLLRVLKLMRTGNDAHDSALFVEDFRPFVCKNTTNEALKRMQLGQHDSGEFLKIMLDYLQHYSSHHFNIGYILNGWFELFAGGGEMINVLSSEVISPIIKSLADFGNIEQLSVDLFRQSVLTRINALQVKILEARLKDAIQRVSVEDINKCCMEIADFVAKNQDMKSNFGCLSTISTLLDFDASVVHVIRQLNNNEIISMEEGTREILKGWLNFNDVNVDDSETATKIFADKIKSYTIRKNEISLLKCPIEQVNLIKDRLMDPLCFNGLTLDAKLNAIRALGVELKNLFGVCVNNQYVNTLLCDLPIEDGAALAGLVKENENGYPICYVQDLLNREQFSESLPTYLIVYMQPFSRKDIKLPNVGGFSAYFEKKEKMRAVKRGHKYPIAFQPTTQKKIKINDTEYRSVGTVYHRGLTMQGGHFIAACSDPWRTFNDPKVKPFESKFINDDGSLANRFFNQVIIYKKVQ